jgi:hypothetical protein
MWANRGHGLDLINLSTLSLFFLFSSPGPALKLESLVLYLFLPLAGTTLCSARTCTWTLFSVFEPRRIGKTPRAPPLLTASLGLLQLQFHLPQLFFFSSTAPTSTLFLFVTPLLFSPLLAPAPFGASFL